MPLNEECGLLEWVNNTVPLRSILTKLYEREKKKVFVSTQEQHRDAPLAYHLSVKRHLQRSRQCSSWWSCRIRKGFQNQGPESVRLHLVFSRNQAHSQTHLLPRFAPYVFHQWFFEMWPEPNAWFTARTAYARTLAVMSIVGFVLG